MFKDVPLYPSYTIFSRKRFVMIGETDGDLLLRPKL